jgi:succinate dehydrogenase/fumarate reductase flavoprotein subunit
VQGLYAAGDMASVPHNYMLGAFVNGAIAGEDAAEFAAAAPLAEYDAGPVEAERLRVSAPLKNEDGLPPNQVEYKIRRLVNDYLQPPKVTRKYEIAQRRFAEIRADLPRMMARDPHELMRALEVHSILDCADMAASASLFRTESRWGLYHHRTDFPERNDADWFCHVLLSKDEYGRMVCNKRSIEPYIVPIDPNAREAYHRLRIPAHA